jgi:predicted ester cyclase
MSSTLLDAKQLVWQTWNLQTGANSAHIADVVQAAYAADTIWWGGYPLNDLYGISAVTQAYWQPLLHALPDLVRRTDILMGNVWQGNDWVSGTGYFVGTFVNDWLGIPASGQTVYIRFGEFCKVEGGKITETRILFDFPDVMRQIGRPVLLKSLGDEIIVPGPEAQNGIILHTPDAAETARSLKMVEDMIDGLRAYDGVDLDSQNMPAFWHTDMKWYGPLGHGSYYTLHDFIYVYEKAFFHGIQPNSMGTHVCRHADGDYVASTGWPSIRAVQGGEYLGAPASGKEIEMRVMDWWTRKGDLLYENWIFIDVPHLFMQLDIDLFAQMQQTAPS